jgi:hypothetical protein
VISTGSMASVRASGCSMEARVSLRKAEKLTNRR